MQETFPEQGVDAAWQSYQAVFLDPDAALSPRTKELIALAVSAQIPCDYCAYPPADGRAVDDRLWLRDAHLASLERALGHPVDRDDFLAAWELGWLRVFCQLGFVLADGLDEHRDNRRTDVILNAFDRAKRIADAHLP